MRTIKQLRATISKAESQIAQIQKGCPHEFTFTPPTLKMSPVEGILRGGSIPVYQPLSTPSNCTFEISCTLCEYTQDVSVNKRCPKCLGLMRFAKDSHTSEELGAKGFDSAVVFVCSKCDTKVVCTYWDK